MTTRKRKVAVIQLPEIKSTKQRQNFLCDMQHCIDAERPFVVLDCSNVGELDRSGIYLLLSCLEEAMKRNGDLKLAALPSAAEMVLENFGLYHLFDVHDTTAGAVSSFHKLRASALSQTDAPLQDRSQPGSVA